MIFTRARELLLFFLALAFSLVLVEGVLRIASRELRPGSIEELGGRFDLPEPGIEATLGSMLYPSPHPRIVYELKPGLDVLFRPATLAKASRVRTNLDGWREDAIETPKPQGTIRIVALGDSFLFGWGVEEPERFLDLFEALLNEHLDGPRVETVALAVPGYNLAMEVEVLEHYGMAYEPDLILYNHIGNDDCLPNFVVDRKQMDPSPIYLLRYLRRLRGLWEEDDEPSSLQGQLDGRSPLEICTAEPQLSEPYLSLAGPEAFQRAFGHLVSIGQELDVPVLVTAPFRLPPDLAQAARHRDGIYGHEGRREIFEYFDRHDLARPKRGVFGTGASSPLVISTSDPHPSIEGHRVIAESLFRYSLESGLSDRLLGAHEERSRALDPP